MHIQPIPCDLYGEICYLVSTDAGDAAVVDPGPGAERLLPLLEALDLTLRGILLTHGHLDHVGGVAAVAGSSCPVWIHPADLGIRAPIFGRLSGTRAYGEGDAPAVGGLRFRVLHTPGHTPGSVCLLCDEPASPDVPPVLFTGDTGPLYIAEAVGTKTLSLWGPTMPEIYGPLTEGHVFLRSPYECVACCKTRCEKKTNGCMEALKPEVAAEALRRFFATAT